MRLALPMLRSALSLGDFSFMAAVTKGNAEHSSPLRLVLFLVCLLLCIGSFYLLADYQMGAEPRLSGELILGQVDTVSYQHQDAPIRNFFFEYFGLLSYLWALLFVYVGYFICFKPVDIFHIDFYKVSLRILGFNLTLLGLAALFSRYSDLHTTGAGGLLGDMLNMFCDLFLPHVISVFIFAFVTFSGLAFMCAKSPLYIFDKVGEAFFKVLPARDEDKDSAAKKKAKTKTKEQSVKSHGSVDIHEAALAQQAAKKRASEQAAQQAAASAAAAAAVAAATAAQAEESESTSTAHDTDSNATPSWGEATMSFSANDTESLAPLNQQPYAAVAVEEQQAATTAQSAAAAAILQPIDPRNPATIPSRDYEYARMAEQEQEQERERAASYIPTAEELAAAPFLDGLDESSRAMQSAASVAADNGASAAQIDTEQYVPEDSQSAFAATSGPQDVSSAAPEHFVAGTEGPSLFERMQQMAQTSSVSASGFAAAAPASAALPEADAASAVDAVGATGVAGVASDATATEQLNATPSMEYDTAYQADAPQELDSDPSLAPFSADATARAVTEPVQTLAEMESTPSTVAPMPTMPHTAASEFEPPVEPEYSPYAAYQQKMQALSSSSSDADTFGSASGAGAATNTVTAADVATNEQALPDSAAASLSEAELSPYGYGTYAEQFIPHKTSVKDAAASGGAAGDLDQSSAGSESAPESSAEDNFGQSTVITRTEPPANNSPATMVESALSSGSSSGSEALPAEVAPDAISDDVSMAADTTSESRQQHGNDAYAYGSDDRTDSSADYSAAAPNAAYAQDYSAEQTAVEQSQSAEYDYNAANATADTDSGTGAYAQDDTSTVDNANSADSADTSAAAEPEPEDDGGVHTIVQRTDPAVFAAQLAAQKKAREEAEAAAARAEQERLEQERLAAEQEAAEQAAQAQAQQQAEDEAAAQQAAEADAASKDQTTGEQPETASATHADNAFDEDDDPALHDPNEVHTVIIKTPQPVKAPESPATATTTTTASSAESTEQDSAEHAESDTASEKSTAAEVGAGAAADHADAAVPDSADVDVDDEDDEDEDDGPIYAGTYASKLNKDKEAAASAQDVSVSAEDDAEDEGPKYITPGVDMSKRLSKKARRKLRQQEKEAKKAAAAAAESEEDSSRPRTIIQDTRKEFEAAQERARAAASAAATAAGAGAAGVAGAVAGADTAIAAETAAAATTAAVSAAEADSAEKKRDATESAILEALSTIATELKNVTESSLSSRHAHEQEVGATSDATVADATAAAADTAPATKSTVFADTDSTISVPAVASTEATANQDDTAITASFSSAVSGSEPTILSVSAISSNAAPMAPATVAADTPTVDSGSAAAEATAISHEAALAASTSAAAIIAAADTAAQTAAAITAGQDAAASALADAVATAVATSDEISRHDEQASSVAAPEPQVDTTSTATEAGVDVGGFTDFASANTHIQRGSGTPERNLDQVQPNISTTITRTTSALTSGSTGQYGADAGSASGDDNDFLKYAVTHEGITPKTVEVNLFDDDDSFTQSVKREQSLYQPQHAYDFGNGQQAGAIDESLSGQDGGDNDDDFVTGASRAAQVSPMPQRTQNFSFTQIAEAKAAQAAQEAEQRHKLQQQGAAAEGSSHLAQDAQNDAARNAVSASAAFNRESSATETDSASAYSSAADTTAPSAATAGSAPESLAAGGDASAESSVSTTTSGDNIISFNNFGAHEPHTYEVGDLTSAFIPMPSDDLAQVGGHISTGELSSIYEQTNSGIELTEEVTVDDAEVEDTAADSAEDGATSAEDTASSTAQIAANASAADDTDADAADADQAEAAEDEAYDESDDFGDEAEDEVYDAAPTAMAPAGNTPAGMMSQGRMNPMMGMNPAGMQRPQTLVQTMPNGQQVQYVQMPNGQYVPMVNGMVNPMMNMGMQAMPQYMQLPNGQYVPVMNGMQYPMGNVAPMGMMQGMMPNAGMVTPQGAMSGTTAMQPQTVAPAAPTPAAAAAPVAPAAPAAVPAAPAASAATAPAPAGAPMATTPEGMAETQGGSENVESAGGHMSPQELGAHGVSGAGLPTAGNAFAGAHNSSSSNYPSYMAGVAAGHDIKFDAPKSLALCSVPNHQYDEWRPSIDLLARANSHVNVPLEELNKTSERINSVLHSYGIKASVADYLTGPVITRFDLELAPGVKSSAISSIDKELCRNLLVPNVRVVPIIDGSSYVGLEVPNHQRQLITLGDMVSSREFLETKASLPMCLGASVVGAPVVKDLAETPHLLVAGTTGSGKSAGLNTMLISLLLKRSPAELRLILVDPKQLEFSIYKDLPHLITPVITDVAEKTPIALHWCVEEMERRFKLMSLLGVRKLAEYNELIKSEAAAGRSVPDPLWNADMGPLAQSLKPLPWIVVVVEEFADLMAQSGRKKDKENTPESLIARLSAKSRAAGIHLVLVTQTPRSEVVTGMIKANFPSRIAFTVQSRLDSTIVLDDKGAEALLGNGDMLYKFTGASSPTRAHGAFTSNADVKAVVDAWRQYAGSPEYLEDVIAVPEEESDDSGEEKVKELDVKFDQAVEMVRAHMEKRNKPPTITDLQTELGVGYPRAKKIFKQLTDEGIID